MRLATLLGRGGKPAVTLSVACGKVIQYAPATKLLLAYIMCIARNISEDKEIDTLFVQQLR